MQANIVRRVLSSQPHIVLLPPEEVARPLRATPPGGAAAIVQKPLPAPALDRPVAEDRATRSGACRDGDARSRRWSPARCLAVRGGAPARSVAVTGIEPERYFQHRAAAGEDRGRRAAADARRTSWSAPSSRASSASTSATSCAITPASGRRATLTITGIVDLGNKARQPAQHLRLAAHRAEPARPDRRRLRAST